MMSHNKFVYLVVSVILGSGSVVYGQGSDAVSARQYADPNTGLLNIDRATRYIVARDKIAFDEVTTENVWDIEKAIDRVGDQLDDLVSITGEDAPWRWQDIDENISRLTVAGATAAPKPAWQDIVGVTKPLDLDSDTSDLAFGPILGPIRIRESTTGLTQRKLANAKGATVGYTNNRLENGGGAWNTAGALGYPIKWRREGGAGTGKSTTLEISPAFDWRVAQVQGKAENEVEEANISIPVTMYRSPGTDHSALWVAQGKPYFQSDFSGGHQIYGIEGSLEYIGSVFGRQLHLGGFQNLGVGNLQYQVRIIPKLDYSETDRTGVHSARALGDDWFRLGGFSSLDFRTGSANPFDIGASYEFFSTVSGSGAYSSLTQAYITWWLSVNTGMTFKYQKGETPVADQEIDLLTLGLEFKF